MPLPVPGPPVSADAIAARVDRLKAAWPAKPGAEIVDLSADEPLRGDVAWAADAPRRIAGTVRIGNSDKNHGGTFYKGTVRVDPGFRLEGGALMVSAGTLELNGTPDQPIVLRGVTLTCEYTATVKATNVVFDNCRLVKGGGYHWNAGYSAKWVLEDCLLRDTSFDRWRLITTGLKLRRCALVGCTIPPRPLIDLKENKAPVDAAKLVRHEWSEVAGCDFYQCKLAASATLSMRGCNLFGCTVAPDDAPLNSTTDLAVELGLGPADAKLLDDLRARTPSTGTGKVTFAAARSPYANGAFAGR
jgi:hypothetical protein